MKKEKFFNEEERRTLKTIIYEKTGYYIRNNCLLMQTFTRSSYSSEQGGENNEILEFIGDQVLSFYVVKIISKSYGALNSDCEYLFRVRENRFNSLKQEFVSNETLAGVIDKWDIVKYLIVGKSDFLNEIDKQLKVKADLVEAIIGAIAVESNWNEAVLEKAITKMLSIDEKIKTIIEAEYRPNCFTMENSVTTLKELAEHGRCTPPEYEYGTPEQIGYDEDGNPKWVCTCRIINDKTGIIRQVWAGSKKAAKKAAAYLVLCEHFELQNEYGENLKYSVWVYKNGKLEPQYMIKE